jgi:hypothetical protein
VLDSSVRAEGLAIATEAFVERDVSFKAGTSRRSRTRWPHCWRCEARLDRGDAADPDRYDGLCTDCRDNLFQRAYSYGGTAAEVQLRYWDMIDSEREERRAIE